MTLRSAYESRIIATRDYRLAHGMTETPSEEALDAMVPGSAETIKRLAAELENLAQVKNTNGGTIGIYYSDRNMSFGANFGGTNFKFGYRSARHAAAAYDRHVRKIYGDDAVTNDRDAVEAYDLDIRDKINRKR